MKKIIISILYLTGIMLVACNPMKDINDQLDAKGTIFKQSIEETLASADYNGMGGNVKKNQAFSATDQAKDYIPAFLKSKYPGLTVGSVDKITYNFMNAYPDMSMYTTAPAYTLATPTYTLSAADYASASVTIGVAGYFSPLNSADKYLPAILKSAITGASTGSTYLVSYMYADVEPQPSSIQNVNVYSQDFAADLGDFSAYSVTGAQTWSWTSYSGDGYAKMTGFASGANQDNEDWLISPQIDLTGISKTSFNVTQTAKYVSGFWDYLTVQVSTDFNGADPAAATWTTLTLPNMPTGNDWTFVNSGDVDLSAFDGQKIYIGFKYISGASAAATWEVTDLAVNGQKIVTKSAKITTPIAIQEFYTYNSGWKKTTNAYYLTTPDYDSMGETAGKPGQYNNFSSSINPDNYLPQFLSSKFPYGQEGDIMNVVYAYYSGGVKTYADQYSVVNGVWTKYNPTIVKTNQFILANTNEWVFDPTVNYTMAAGAATGDDYQSIIDYVFKNFGGDYIDVVYSGINEAETYYGVHSYYGEFRSTIFNSKFATWQDAAKEAIQVAFLPAKFPNAVAQVDGIDVNYKITFAVYDGSMVNYTILFKCTKSGPNPEFTYVKGPVVGTTIEE